ncbi:MAG: hypothetical protein ACYSUA_02500, partial [Planctomycetota bacterium]
MKYALKPALKAVGIVLLLILTVIVVWAFDARRMPELESWHTTDLEAEFRARDDDQRNLTLGDYLEKEDALFAEFQSEVLSGIEPLADLTL